MLNQFLLGLREASLKGIDNSTRWQNIVEYHVTHGCPVELTPYLQSWWVSHQFEDLDWVCAQWLNLPRTRWERKFADKYAKSTDWLYLVATEDVPIRCSCYTRKYIDYDSKTRIPLTEISWLNTCAQEQEHTQ